MPKISDVNETQREIQHQQRTDREQFDLGYNRGDYASAYETTDYRAAQRKLHGKTGFYRIGFLLGFYATYETTEVPMIDADIVAQYREQFAAWID